MIEKLKKYFRYYGFVRQGTPTTTSWKWRIIAILLAGVGVSFVYNYLVGKYTRLVNVEGIEPFILSDKLFYWFMTGVLFGIIALAVMYEGEFFVVLRRAVKAAEKEANSRVKALVGSAGKRRKKRV
ncbi:hypothetical protein COT29_01795 [Candidatus Micrarchaeota archaeon CG08_land_8_20_14_0_20_59_11]|nr:MAG: hypothetical protein COT29_01795 [Candidatus Micrarchaeota archaeon CG08_land_8_20_14_0_20_59_11]